MQTIALSEVFSYIYGLDHPVIRLYHKILGFFTIYFIFLAVTAWQVHEIDVYSKLAQLSTSICRKLPFKTDLEHKLT